MKLSYLLTVVITTALAACGGSSTLDNGTSAPETVSLPIVAVATDASFPPFEYLNNTGEVMGFDVDLLNAIAADQKFKAAFYNVSFDKIFEHLKNDEAQAVIAAVAITPERKETMIFSEPYFSSTQLALVTENNTATTIDQLSKQRIGVVSDTTSESFIKATFAHMEGTSIITFADVPTMAKDFKENKLDAMISDELVIKDFVKSNKDMNLRTIADANAPVEQWGIAMDKNKASPELMTKINTGLQNIKANGTYDQIYKKYF